MNRGRLALSGAIGFVALAGVVVAALQFVPWSIDPNPPATRAPSWDDPATQALALRAGCMDCHSNETVWPWYTRVAPVGWLAVDHVREGRGKLNLSELDRPQRDAHEAGEVVLEGEMPPAYYPILHPRARLTDAERQRLAAGLDRTLAGVPRAEKVRESD